MAAKKQVRLLKNWQVVYSSSTASNWSIGSGMSADVADVAGGEISRFSALSGGIIAVTEGGSATDITVNGGCVSAGSSGTVTDIKCRLGYVFVLSGGNIAQTTVENGGVVAVSGGIASDITVNGGYAEVNGSGTMTDVQCLQGYVKAQNSGSVSQATVESGGIVAENYGSAYNCTASQGGWITVSSHGCARSNTIESGGYTQAGANGSLCNTVLKNSGIMLLSSGGVASNTTVESGGLMRIYEGGYADGVFLQGQGGVVEVDCGATVNNLQFISGAAGLTAELDSKTNINGTSSGVPFEIQNGKISGFHWSGHVIGISCGIDLFLNLHSGALVDSSILSAGHIQAYAGGTATNDQLHYYAQLNVFSGGCASQNTLDSEAEIYVLGGVLYDTVINQDGYVWVASGGRAYHTQVSSGGRFDIGSSGGCGGFASDTTVFAGGYFQVISGTSASAIEVLQGGTMVVDTGKTNDIALENGAGLYVRYNGSVDDVSLNGGTIFFYRQGIGSSITMNSGIIHATINCDPNEQLLEKDREKFISSAMIYKKGPVIHSLTMNGGAIFLSSGASARTILQNSGQTILSGGVISQIDQKGGSVLASSGSIESWTMSTGSCYGEIRSAVVSGIKVKGTLVVNDGATVTVTENIGNNQFYLHGGTVNGLNTGSGCVCEMTGGSMSSTSVSGTGVLNMSGGSIGTLTQGSGNAGVHINGGTVNSFAMGAGCYADIQSAVVSGVKVQGTLVVNNGATVSVTENTGNNHFYLNGGTVNGWNTGSGCVCEMTGGSMSSTTVSGTGVLNMSGGSIGTLTQGAGNTNVHISGGSVTSAVMGKDCYLDIANATIDSLRQQGVVAINAGGVVKNLIQNDGNVWLSQGTVSYWKIASGTYNTAIGASIGTSEIDGLLEIKSTTSMGNTTVTANGLLALNAAVNMTGNLCFDLTGLNSKESYMVQNLNNITSAGTTYSVKISSRQSSGQYVLANGTADFTKSIAVQTQDGTELGTLSAGETKSFGGSAYTLSNTGGILSLTVDAATPVSAKSDLDGNGISDVMFQYTGGDYQIGFWMNGKSTWQGTGASQPDNWVLLGNYDMDSNDKADQVMFGNVLGGAYIGYYKDGDTTSNGWQNIGYLNNPDGIEWRNVVGNLTGNASKNSIVWQAPELNACGVWTDGTTNWVGISGSFDTNWEMQGCGDFTGDGKDEILWQYNGALYTTDINSNFASLGGWGTAWKVRAIGDFSGDGKDDIVLFHSNTGSVVKFSDGLAENWSSLGQLDASDWFIVGAGDYNNDQKDDLLVRQYSTGMLGYYSAGDMSQWNEMGRGVDMNWTVIA